MDIIDNFFKEMGIFSGINYNQAPSNHLIFGLNTNTYNTTNSNISNPINSLVGNNLALIGSKIQPNRLNDIDDDVLYTLSNEILRFNHLNKEKHLKHIEEYSMTSHASFKHQMNKNQSHNPRKTSKNKKKSSTNSTNPNSHLNVHLSSETNKMLID